MAPWYCGRPRGCTALWSPPWRPSISSATEIRVTPRKINKTHCLVSSLNSATETVDAPRLSEAVHPI